MDEYIKEISNSLDLTSNFLEDIGNGIFLSKKEMEVLDYLKGNIIEKGKILGL